MAKLSRKNQKIFASGATNNGQFGSAVVGTKIKSNDVETLQNLVAYLQGWDSATIGGQKLPTLEEFQALHYITNYQLAYLFQEGISEWNTDTEYFIDSVIKNGTALYSSKTDNNSGNILTDTVNWLYLGDISRILDLENINANINVGVAASVGSNNLTVALKQKDGSSDPSSDKPVYIAVRNNSLNSGAWDQEKISTALSLEVPSGATLGSVDGVKARLYVYLIKDATNEFAISKTLLDDSILHSSIAIDSSADSESSLYSTSVKTNKPIKLLGYLDSIQASAGTWVSTPSKIFIGRDFTSLEIGELPNQIISGQSRSLSSMPDFLRPSGVALAFDVLGSTTDLVLLINGELTIVNSDLNKSSIQAAPSVNNTADVNDLSIINDLYAGEDGGVITIDNVGSEITSLVGQIVAFKTPTGEIFKGLLKSTTEIVDVFRGFYFNNSGTPISRGVLSDGNTIQLMKIGWVFVENDSSTIDITYRTPIESYSSPTSPQTGDYWYDIINQVWKRYTGALWEGIDRILVGEIVSDTTVTLGARSYDFTKDFDKFNNIELDIFSTSIIRSKNADNKINVYGTEIGLKNSFLNWNIVTDLESPLAETISTDYYLYISDKGQLIISDEKPYYRGDLKGKYHPYHSWRAIGVCFNDSVSNLVIVSEIGFNSELKSANAFIKDVKPNNTNGGGATVGWNTRVLNTIESEKDFVFIDSNQFYILPGLYKVKAHSPAMDVNANRNALYNVDDANYDIIGSNEYATNAGTGHSQSKVWGAIRIHKTTRYELQMWIAVTDASFGAGQQVSAGTDEIYAQIDLTKRG